jgi:hypothetical protein
MANGQTIIQYGDDQVSGGSKIMLYRCQTGTVQQRPVFDSSRTVMYWKFTITGVGYLNGLPYGCQYSQVITSSSSSSSAQGGAILDKQIRWRLKERQKFVMATGCDASNSITSGKILLSANPMTTVTSPRAGLPTGLTGYDVDDGPRCLQFDIIRIAGDNVFQVAYAFEINIVMCDDASGSPNNTNGVLSNRWSVNDTWDHSKRTIRTYTGLVELATSQFNPHWFRNLVVPPLQPGMRRDYGSFTATEDGKHLQYTITDTEVVIACPAPATRWDIQHSETVLSQDGLKVTSSCAVTLEGQSNCDVGQLIVLGLYVLSIKLAGVKPGDPVVGVIFINDVTITEFVGDVNRVSVSGSAWRPAVNMVGIGQRAQGFNTVIKAIDLPPFSAATFDPLRSTDARVGENTQYQGPQALAGIFRCYLQSSCSSIQGITGAQENLNADTQDNPKYPAEVRIVPSIDNSPVPYYSSSQNTATYSKFQMEAIYSQKSMKVAMPIARGPYTGTDADLRTTIAVPQLSNGICYVDVRILADRLGEQPQMPSPERLFDGSATYPYVITNPDTGEILKPASPYGRLPLTYLDGKLLGRTQTMSANGIPLYHAEWNGRYVLDRSYYPNEILRIGNNQWETPDQLTNSTQNLTNSYSTYT